MRRAAIAAWGLAACGYPSPLLHVAGDAAKDSAAHDAPSVDAVVPVGQHYHYVIDHQYVPTNNTQARQYGLDLNGDGVIDNQLGMVLATFANMGFDVQGATNTAVDHGYTLMLPDLQTLDLQSASHTGFTTFFGINPNPPACNGGNDPVCRHHLTGSAQFAVDSNSPHDPPLLGDATANTFASGPGVLDVQLVFVTGLPTAVHLVAAHSKLSSVTSTAIGNGVIGGGVLKSDVDGRLIPALQQALTIAVQRDCCGTSSSPSPTCDPSATPSCGCIDSTTGKSAIGLFDTTPHDCAITVSEIQGNSLIQSLLAPDITVDGQQALSMGFGMSAVGATYTP